MLNISDPVANSCALHRDDQLNVLLRCLKITEFALPLNNFVLPFNKFWSHFQMLNTSRSPLTALTVLKKICDHPRLLSNRQCLQLGLDMDEGLVCSLISPSKLLGI